jgi:hypothetical protein
MASKDKETSMSSYEEQDASGSGNQPDSGSLAQRRARLRGTLSKTGGHAVPFPEIDDFAQAPASEPASQPNPAVADEEQVTASSEADVETREASPSLSSALPRSTPSGSRPELPPPFIPQGQEKSKAEAAPQVQITPALIEELLTNIQGSLASLADSVGHLQSDKTLELLEKIDESLSTIQSDKTVGLLENIDQSLSQCNDNLQSRESDKTVTLLAKIEATIAENLESFQSEEVVGLLNKINGTLGSFAKTLQGLDTKDAMEKLSDIEKSVTACTNVIKAQKPEKAISLLNDIDQVMNACATNLAALQKVASEQVDLLKNLNDTVKNQTLREIGMNLNVLTESMSTAIEPMKAVGELVPVIDQLVAAIEAREAGRADDLTADQLVMNLADQLACGAIDPWTFKCAYMAIFPEDHPADLLRRLVELLGTQRLSGDLFRAAYEAVQAATPPPSYLQSLRQPRGGLSSDEAGYLQGGNYDEELRAQLEALHKANEELRQAKEEGEDEYEQLLAAKEQELEEVHEAHAVRYEELNERYKELTEELAMREGEYHALLQNKEMKLSEKESEASLLRGQIEELRLQFEELAKMTQQQRSEIRKATEEAKAQGAEPAPSKPAGYASFFDTAPARPKSPSLEVTPETTTTFVSDNDEEAEAPANAQPEMPAPAPMPEPVVQPPVAAPAPAPAPAPMAAPVPAPVQAQTQPAQPAQPAPQTTLDTSAAKPAGGKQAFGSGAGSYGSGVRAQVFEVIVRQALAGAPWREICAGPMQVNNISPEEVEAEVKRRQDMLNK